MIIEGIPCVILGIITWFWLADEPETAYYLDDHQRQLMIRRREREFGLRTSAHEFHKKDVYAGLKDWKIYMFCAGQFCADNMLYSYSTFLPTIIKGINSSWSNQIVQVLTIPCYALGALSYLGTAWVSDHFQRRGIPTVLLCIVSIIGYALLISDTSSGVHFAGCFFVAMGLYVTVGIPLAWLPSNNPRYGKRTTASGLQLTIGNSAGIMAPFRKNPITTRILLCLMPRSIPHTRRSVVSPRPWRDHGASCACSGDLWRDVRVLQLRQPEASKWTRGQKGGRHDRR